MNEETTAADVAQWMEEQLFLSKAKTLTHDAAVNGIQAKFGAKFLASDGTRIAQDVLVKFREFSGHTTIWDPHNMLWRYRGRGDKPGRRQD